MTSFEKYKQYLEQIHALIAVGEGDSEEADHIRDLADAPGLRLTAAEREEARLYSAELYRRRGE